MLFIISSDLLETCWDIEVLLRYWDIKILRHWDNGILRYWDTEKYKDLWTLMPVPGEQCISCLSSWYPVTPVFPGSAVCPGTAVRIFDTHFKV